jgi:outer membrane biosynthesis protein TonB
MIVEPDSDDEPVAKPKPAAKPVAKPKAKAKAKVAKPKPVAKAKPAETPKKKATPKRKKAPAPAKEPAAKRPKRPAAATAQLGWAAELNKPYDSDEDDADFEPGKDRDDERGFPHGRAESAESE